MSKLDREQRIILLRILIGAAVLALLLALDPSGYLRFVLFLIPYLILGYDVLWEAAKNISKGHCLDECFLMTIATAGAICLGEYAEASAVMLFQQIGGLFESIAVARSRRSIDALMDIRPETAIVLEENQERTVKPEEVAVGSVVLVRPGMRIPLDGVILSGDTTVDQRALTGESVPEDKHSGDTVFSGSINLTGVIHIRTTVPYENSTAAQILSLAEAAEARKAQAENFITRFSRRYTPCVVIAAIIAALIPPLFFGQPWGIWINRALIFLMISCPCALVISVPLTFFSGIGGASRIGVLLKGADALESLAKIDAIAMDKTGTLTEGRFSVTEIRCAHAAYSEHDLLSYAAALESQSTHPIAQAITAAAAPNDLTVTALKEEAGRGIRGIINGEVFYAGNAAWLEQNGIVAPACDAVGTLVHLAEKDAYLGVIVVADTLKSDSKNAVAMIRSLGIREIAMLTGDRKEIAESIGNAVGIHHVSAELLPADKVTELEKLMESSNTAFVGDGINDAPVLVRSDVGIAMGALGSEAAMEAADVVIMDDRLPKIASAIKIARKTMQIVRQNIIFAISVKILILLLGLLGYADLWLAVLGDVGVLILAVCNALRAMKIPHLREN